MFGANGWGKNCHETVPPRRVPMASNEAVDDDLPTSLVVAPKGTHTCLRSCRDEVP